MSVVTIEKVKVNRGKFKELRGATPVAEFADTIGVTPDMWSKIERGQRWNMLDRFAEFCAKSGREPNEFFEIVKKIS